MKVQVIQQHDGEGRFPMFAKGTEVTLTGGECTDFLHWFPCEIDGHETYVPESFIDSGGRPVSAGLAGTLTRDYNPTELVQNTGDILEVKEIVNAWLFAENAGGQTGWIPAEAVVSVPGNDD